MFESENASAGKSEETKDDKSATSGAQDDKSSEKKSFTQDEVGKLIAEERKAERAKAKADFEQKQKDDAEAAKTEREQDEAKARGEFEKVEAQLKADLDTAKRELDALRERSTKLTEAIEKVLADDWEKLPEEIRTAYTAAGGADDDPLAKINYLPTAKKLTEAMSTKRETREGTRQNPQPKNGENNGDVESEKKALRATGSYRM